MNLDTGQGNTTISKNRNVAKFEECKDSLKDRFEIGTYVAIDDGELVADAPTFDKLSKKLKEQGRDRTDVFVVHVAETYPDSVFILL
jgi:hypothetical protein